MSIGREAVCDSGGGAERQQNGPEESGEAFQRTNGVVVVRVLLQSVGRIHERRDKFLARGLKVQ